MESLGCCDCAPLTTAVSPTPVLLATPLRLLLLMFGLVLVLVLVLVLALLLPNLVLGLVATAAVPVPVPVPDPCVLVPAGLEAAAEGGAVPAIKDGSSDDLPDDCDGAVLAGRIETLMGVGWSNTGNFGPDRLIDR